MMSTVGLLKALPILMLFLICPACTLEYTCCTSVQREVALKCINL